MKCITVKGKEFEHQFLYTGVGEERRCHFCQADEAYPGQNYFHKYNVNIKHAELDWEGWEHMPQSPSHTDLDSKS